jgi:hypothetical protein
MTKTQHALIAEALRNPHHTVSVNFGVHARRRFGSRESNAARKLREQGVFVLVNSSGATPLYKPGSGQNGVAYLVTYKFVGTK